MHMNEKSANYSIKKILNFKINNRRKNFLIEIKNYLIYKIKYKEYNEGEDSLK